MCEVTRVAGVFCENNDRYQKKNIPSLGSQAVKLMSQGQTAVIAEEL